MAGVQNHTMIAIEAMLKADGSPSPSPRSTGD